MAEKPTSNDKQDLSEPQRHNMLVRSGHHVGKGIYMADVLLATAYDVEDKIDVLAQDVQQGGKSHNLRLPRFLRTENTQRSSRRANEKLISKYEKEADDLRGAYEEMTDEEIDKMMEVVSSLNDDEKRALGRRLSPELPKFLRHKYTEWYKKTSRGLALDWLAEDATRDERRNFLQWHDNHMRELNHADDTVEKISSAKRAYSTGITKLVEAGRLSKGMLPDEKRLAKLPVYYGDFFDFYSDGSLAYSWDCANKQGVVMYVELGGLTTWHEFNHANKGGFTNDSLVASVINEAFTELYARMVGEVTRPTKTRDDKDSYQHSVRLALALNTDGDTKSYLKEMSVFYSGDDRDENTAKLEDYLAEKHDGIDVISLLHCIAYVERQYLRIYDDSAVERVAEVLLPSYQQVMGWIDILIHGTTEEKVQLRDSVTQEREQDLFTWAIAYARRSVPELGYELAQA